MFDATGKPESGVLTGGFTFLGFYSECLEAVKDPLDSHFQPPFVSTYCLTTMDVSNIDEDSSVVSILGALEANQG